MSLFWTTQGSWKRFTVQGSCTPLPVVEYHRPRGLTPRELISGARLQFGYRSKHRL